MRYRPDYESIDSATQDTGADAIDMLLGCLEMADRLPLDAILEEDFCRGCHQYEAAQVRSIDSVPHRPGAWDACSSCRGCLIGKLSPIPGTHVDKRHPGTRYVRELGVS